MLRRAGGPRAQSAAARTGGVRIGWHFGRVTGLALALLFTQPVAHAQTILLSDNFGTSTPTTNIGAELATRQAGSLATTTWTSSFGTGHTLGYGGAGVIRFAVDAGSGANLISISPNRNFTQNPGVGGYSYLKLDLEPGTVGVDISWVAISIGDTVFRSSWGGWGVRAGFSIFFRRAGAYNMYDGTASVGSGVYTGAPGQHTIELRAYDPAGGSAFDGSGASKVEVYVDGATTPLTTYTKPNPGYGANVVTLFAEHDPGVPTSFHHMDNLEIGTSTFPSLAVSPGSLSLGPTQVGDTSAAQGVTLTNTGAGSVAVSSVSAVGAHASLFNIAKGTCASLTPFLATATSCALTVSFTPTAFGASPYSATLQVVSAAGTSSVTLSGSAAPTQPIPTLSQWGVLLLFALLAGSMVVASRRRALVS